MFSVYPFPLWLLREYTHCLIIIIKLEVRTIIHCLGLGHEIMVCAVCLSIFLCCVVGMGRLVNLFKEFVGSQTKWDCFIVYPIKHAMFTDMLFFCRYTIVAIVIAIPFPNFSISNWTSSAGTVLTAKSTIPDSKVHGANMGPIWGRQDPGGPHVGPVNFAIWDMPSYKLLGILWYHVKFVWHIVTIKIADGIFTALRVWRQIAFSPPSSYFYHV